MPDFTPGPWRCDEYPACWDINADGSLGGGICSISIKSEIDKANARLIAAAPEMYESLQEAVKSCPCSLRERDSGHRVDCYVPRALEVLAEVEATHA